MCGIAGFIDNTLKKSNPELNRLAKNMAATLAHRGPDHSGEWMDQESGLALGHRRLSILDLSIEGNQPMVSRSGRYVLIHNGEIYNYRDLKKDLEKNGYEWRGNSDTEVMLASFETWGIKNSLKRFNGMFAFALWDRKERSLFLARDRMGIKPLYYGQNNGIFLFGSQLKAITAHPAWQGEIDRDAITQFLRYCYVPTPWSIYKGVFKLPAAHFIVVREKGKVISEPHCFWDLASIAEQGASSAKGTAEELTEELEILLRDSVKKRMISDVPLGTFLSGGYDSTTVTAIMQAQSEQPIRTFSIGVYNETLNEARHAKAIAQHLGTDHTELYVTPEEAMNVIPGLPTMWDEPFSDSSQIPTFLVSQLARKNVTVSLSGDGGDELFAGYYRHIVGPAIWERARRLPIGLRRMLGLGMGFLARHNMERLRSFLPQRMAVPNLADRLNKLPSSLKAKNGQAFYKDLVSHWKDPASLVSGGKELYSFLDRHDHMPDLPGLREQMMYLDMMTYLPDEILTKVDRASMAVSLEARVPLLDHRLVEFAWRVPTKYKYRDGVGKWILRQVLYRYVPQDLMDRPKQGFGVPIEHWLRGPLREWAEELLDEKRLREEGYLDPVPIRRMWEEHVSGKRRWHHYLWDVLMFQAWLEETKAQ